jgi:hypothetical protein
MSLDRAGMRIGRDFGLVDQPLAPLLIVPNRRKIW